MPPPGHADLIGAWTLLDWYIRYPDGRETQPYQPAPSGLLLYTNDGWMSATIQAGGRRPFSASSPAQAGEREKARAFDGFFHYSGRWEIRGDTVRHQVAFALNPGMTGQEQVRHVTLDGDRLTLQADEKANGQSARRHVLRWRRRT